MKYSWMVEKMCIGYNLSTFGSILISPGIFYTYYLSNKKDKNNYIKKLQNKVNLNSTQKDFILSFNGKISSYFDYSKIKNETETDDINCIKYILYFDVNINPSNGEMDYQKKIYLYQINLFLRKIIPIDKKYLSIISFLDNTECEGEGEGEVEEIENTFSHQY